MSLLDRFTAHLKHVIARAGSFVITEKVRTIAPTHLLLALALERGSLGYEILTKVRVRAETIRETLGIPVVHEDEAAPPAVKSSKNTKRTQALPALSKDAKRVFEKAALAATNHQHRYIGTEHLLAGILDTGTDGIRNVLTACHVDPGTITQHLQNVLKSTSKFPEFTETIKDPRLLMAEEEAADEGTQDQKTPALDFFAKDLTEPATTAKIDPVIGRELEIERVIQILCRRTKNNPILVGEPGVGKTAIVEGLARRIVERDVPDILVGKRILALDLALVVAGTIYRGEFESRLKQILDEVRQDVDLILFIDEIHTIMGAGAASGSLDAANILKPALARGEIRCIGATTYDEYKKHVENDAALERRFQQVHVAEPSALATVTILHGLKPYYEQFHHVHISDSAIDAAVRFAERYITDRQFPDKAIDLVDEAAARLRVQTKNDPHIRRANQIEAALEHGDEEKRKAVLEDRFDDAARIRKEHLALGKELQGIHEQLKQRKTEHVGEISDRHVAAVIAQILNLPVEEILLEEHERLRTISNALRSKIIGQDAAVEAIAAALRRAKSGLSNPNRPLASFLLLGPTGVGKTETAKALAELVFHRADALIRLDMSEFSEGFTVSKLVGAPAGYVGYREGSKLTDTIRQRPASVVLFDEIEKAHPDVWNLLLQILEDGRLTDATGREVRFTNAIIILTSNIGAGAFTKSGIGFAGGGSKAEALLAQYDDIRADALKELRSRFRPELLNRIDETIIYNPLEQVHLAHIAKLGCADFAERLDREQHITISIADEVYDWIAARAFDPAQGARAVRRILHALIENPVATGILEERFSAGDAIEILTPTNDRDVLTIMKRTATRKRSKVKTRT